MDPTLGIREEFHEALRQARQHLRRRRRLPPRGPPPDRARRRRHQDRDHRRRQQPHRPRPRRADVRGRSAGDRRDRPPLRQEGRGPRPRRRRHQPRAPRRRRFDRARHPARRREHPPVPPDQRLSTCRRFPPSTAISSGCAPIPTPIPARSARRSNGGSASPARAFARAFPAGVRIAFGTDAGVSMHGRNADEFVLMVKHGMTPAAAIAGGDRQRRRSARPLRRGRHDRARQDRRHRRRARRSARRRRRAPADELRDGPRPRPQAGALICDTSFESFDTPFRQSRLLG